MFRAMFSPILSSNLTVYTALVHCTDLLPNRDTCYRSVHCTKAVYTVKLLLRQKHPPKHVELI
jgi:hypothetical protein